MNTVNVFIGIICALVVLLGGIAMWIVVKIDCEERRKQVELNEETRVRMNASQTAKGYIQLDVTAEAPTVEKARELMGQALDALAEEVAKRGLVAVHKVA